jgi:hypothetical protein
MKIGVLICVLMVVSLAAQDPVVQPGAFESARCVPNVMSPTFFIFSTSFGRYTIGNNGMGELGANGKKRLFYLNTKIRLVGRLKAMYFREHEGDLLLLYQVSDGKVYLARMIQESKKIRWFTLVKETDPGPCLVEGDEVHCGEAGDLTKINLTKGNHVS